MNTQYSELRPSPQNLIEAELNQVRRIAHYYHGRVSGVIEVEDLIQVGNLGLIDAAQRYVHQEGVTFASYAGIRIRGAIVDHLRRASHLCRTTIAMRQKVKRATESLERRHQRAPSAMEISSEAGMNIHEYEEWRVVFQANTHNSIDEVMDDFSIWFHSKDDNPEENLAKVEMKAALRLALEVLSQKEALVIQLYYVEELNVYEIAEVLEVTTGRVSQIKKAAILRLRDRLAEILGESEL
jgi:RNA polymerase sigma factor FliA